MQRKLVSLLIACAVGSLSSPAFSLDDKAVLKRLDQLEAQRKADQAEISALRNKVQQLEGEKGEAISSAEATKLREEIVKVDKKASSRVDSMKKTIDSERDKLKINGYMSVYGVKSTDKVVTLGTGVQDQIGFNSDTVAGVQFDYKVDEKLDAVVQLQAAGNDDYDVDTPWAFLRYKLAPSTQVRAGRMITPLYLYADSLDIGFTYAWVRPPVEMYGTFAARHTGVDLTHTFNFGGWNNSVQFVFGDADASTSSGRIDSKYVAGVVLTGNYDALTLRVSDFHYEDLQSPALNNTLVSLGQPRIEGSSNYLSGAVRYDNGAWLAIIEGRKIDSEKSLQALIADTDGFYATLGYQFGDLMPYATWAKAYSANDLPTALSGPQHQESLGLGLRYNLSNKVVLKGEATRYDHFDGTAGITGFATLPTAPAERAAALQRLDDDGVTVMSLGVDAIF